MGGDGTQTPASDAAGSEERVPDERVSTRLRVLGWRWTVRSLLIVGYALALAALAVIAASSYGRIGALVADQAPIAQSHQVLRSIDQVRAHVRDAERAQRG